MRTPPLHSSRSAPGPPTRRGTRASRPGLTLIEVVVALAVLGVGILTLADATAAMQRRVIRDAWRMRAAELVVSRFESMAALPCDALAAGSRELHGVRERWDVTVEPPFARAQSLVDVNAFAPVLALEATATLWCGGG